MRLIFATATLFSSLAWPMTVTPEAVEVGLDQAELIADVRILSREIEPHPKLYAVTHSNAEIEVIHFQTDSRPVSRSIRIVTAGGEIGDRGLVYSGMPKPFVGRRYRAHLKTSTLAPGEYEITGFEQGLIPLDGLRAHSRNRTDGSNGQGNGNFLYWDPRSLPIPYFISARTFKDHIPYVDAIDQSFKTWRDLKDTKLEFVSMGCSNAIENENDGMNNIILVQSDWEFDAAAIAITRNFYVADLSERAGLILDTDILLNGVNHEFTTTGDVTKHDVQNILTHEIGHFIGLGHEVAPKDTSASMYEIAGTGETKKRMLHASDQAGAREAYGGVGDKRVPPATICNLQSGPGCAAVHGEKSGRDGFLTIGVFILAMAVSVLSQRRRQRLT